MYRLRQRRASRGGFSLADAFGYVGTGFGAVPSAGDSDGVDGAVELAVAVAA